MLGTALMGLAVITDMVSHACGKQIASSIFQTGFHLSFNAIDDMPFTAPMIRQVAGGILHHPDPDIIHHKYLPGRKTGSARALFLLYGRPVERLKRKRGKFHRDPFFVGLCHFPCPFIPVFGAEFPGREIIFNIAEHAVPFLWCIAVFHNKGTA